MADYMLFMWGGNQHEWDEERMGKHMKRWGNWMGKLGKAGALLDAAPLAPTGQHLAGRRKKLVDAPCGEEIADRVTGYVKIKARSQKAATEIAKGCPHFESGGRVEVRPVASM